MFTLRISAIGRDGSGPMAALTEDYLKRARDVGRGLGIDGPHLSAFDAPKGLAGAARQAKEASLLLSSASGTGPVLMLDERGKDLKSRELSTLIARWRDDGADGADILIGGADGFARSLAEDLSPRPVTKLAFGRATWPHLMVRLMLAEQLYRTATLLAGHPYHRD